MEQNNYDLSEAMAQLSVTTDNSDNSSTQPKNLSDMPFDVVGLIIERSDYKQQLILRKVSKTLRALVDKQKPACKSIEIGFYGRTFHIKFDNHFVLYTNRDLYYDVEKYADPEGGPFTRVSRREKKEFEKVGFNDLASTLKNPKLKLEYFSVVLFADKEKYTEKRFNELGNVMKSLNHQVSVKEFEINLLSPRSILSVLPYLKPGVLEIISLRLDIKYYDDWKDDTTEMDQVALLEQWKQAEELELQYCFERFPMEYATHFKRFRIIESFIDGETFDRIKDFLSELEDFEYCRIPACRLDITDDVQEMMGTPVSPNMSHYSIPDSDYCLEFSIESYGITIVKKICHMH